MALMCLERDALAQCSGGTWTVGSSQRQAGPFGTVNAAISFDLDGAGPGPVGLVVGGYFPYGDQFPMNHVAFWDGTAWHPIGEGFNGQVNSLAIHNGELYAGGSFTGPGPSVPFTPLNGVARWRNGHWEALGQGITSPGGGGRQVNAMASYNGRLYVGGLFTTAGGAAANNIASFDTSTSVWRSLGTGGTGGGGGVEQGVLTFSNRVNTLAVFDGRLIVGGLFVQVNGTSLLGSSLARWDGTNWGGIGVTAPGGRLPVVNTLATFSTTTTTYLYAGGEFGAIGGVTADYVARYPKTSTTDGPWIQIGTTPIPLPVDKIILSGTTTAVSTVTVNAYGLSSTSTNTGVWRFASGVWNLFAPEQATCLTNFGGVVAGIYPSIGLRVGNDWIPFGAGLNGINYRLISHAGSLYAIGDFKVADGQVVNGAARLNGQSWEPVGAGVLGTGRLAKVSDVASNGTELFVLGDPVGNGLSYTVFRLISGNFVQELGSAEQNARLSVSGGEVFLTASFVRRWTPAGFVTLGQALTNASVRSVVVQNGQYYALGGGAIYKYNPQTAQWVIDGMPSGYCDNAALVTPDNRVFLSLRNDIGIPIGVYERVGTSLVSMLSNVASNDFLMHNGRAYMLGTNGLYVLNGSTWDFVADVGGLTLTSYQGDLIVGNTQLVGTQLSLVYARLHCCPADFNGMGGVTVQDIFDFLTAWFTGSPSADFNGAAGVTVQDVFDFLTAWFQGC